MFYSLDKLKPKTKTKNQICWLLTITEILSQFEIIAEMDILKNQWRSTGGKSQKFLGQVSFDGDICGLNGGIKRFQADQTTEKCDPMKPGAISGLYNGKNTTTELIGAGNALLYQVFNNVNGVDTLEHSQLTTLTTLADGRSVFDLFFFKS